MSRGQYLLILPLLLALFAGKSQEQPVDNSSPEKNRPLAESPRRDRPNIIFILTDDQDTASLAAMPRTNKLFPLVFKNHFLTDPLCCPSRETFMTGQYAHNHGVRSNREERGLLPQGRPFGGWWSAGSRRENVGRWLKKTGYHTALIGKYLNGLDARKKAPRGWSDTFLALDKRKGYFNYAMLDKGRLQFFGEKPGEYSTNVITDRAIKNVQKSKKEGKPLFLFLSYNTPHNGTTSSRQPRLDPEPHPRDRRVLLGDIPDAQQAPNFDAFDDKKPKHMTTLPRASERKIAAIQNRILSRWQSLYSLDRQIARLVRAVARAGEEDNTYFFFTTDNGYFLGQHRLLGKFLPYEEATRFPLLLKTPDKISGQREELVANIDFVPTVLDLAKAKAGKNHLLDGKNLLPLIKGHKRRWRREILFERFPSMPPWPDKGPREPYLAVRTRDDVYIRYQKNGIWPTTWSGEEEYYDLRTDPYQLNNIADNPAKASRINYLRSRLLELENCQGSACP